jgi:hypothetical protein
MPMPAIRDVARYARRVFRSLGGPAIWQPPRDGAERQLTKVHRLVTDMAECDFYHIVELPDGRLTTGQWDLRATVDQYLGDVDFAGKRVIEIGPASGFLSFYMEKKGARMVCVEPPMYAFWDLVSRPGGDGTAIRRGFAEHITRIRNSFWYLHHLYGSNAECYETNVYQLSPDIARFDIAVFGSVLLHCRSPVKMLEAVGNLVEEGVVICERYFGDIAEQPVCRLVPSRDNGVNETWWEFSPLFFQQYLGVIGFANSRVTRHRQWYAAGDSWVEMFTVVATR